MSSIQLSELELRRYKRQIQIPEIGEEGQLKLKQAKVLVIGAGGMGTPVLQYLAAAGIGTLGICDNEYVNESNFHRQIMYGASDLGKLKTIVAKEKLTLLNPLTEFKIHNIAINEENAAFICNDYHVVVDATNNQNASNVIYKTCCALNIPLIIGINEGFVGFILVCNGIEEKYQSFQKQYSSSTRGLIGVTAGLIGCMQAYAVVKILLGGGASLFGKLLNFDASTFSLNQK
jgi:sulfur-carrier protein adenylyltransferase/sulfurtransferase